jgi:hypothetical protein
MRLRAVSRALAARPVHPPPMAWASTKLRSGSSSMAYRGCASVDSSCQVLDHRGRFERRAGTDLASHYPWCRRPPPSRNPSSARPLGGGGCRMPRSHDMWSGEDLG